jgi:phosphatidylserine/phosphatidylglycerophosphate/cardiolipin synthase-like enzyme
MIAPCSHFNPASNYQAASKCTKINESTLMLTDPQAVHLHIRQDLMRLTSRKAYLFVLLASLAASCKTTNSSGLSSESTVTRAAEIHKFVATKLRAASASSEGSLWFESSANFSDDWIVQSPENYWGKTGSSLPKNLDCNARVDEGCDPQFSRFTCSVDADCADLNTTCQDLLASVAAAGVSPKKMCLGSGDSLLNRFYTAMVGAKVQLDVTSLSYHNGRFYQMLVNSLAYLSHQTEVPTVRLLFSGYVAEKLNIANTASNVLKTLMQDVATQGGDLKRLQVELGWLSTLAQPRWNHSKIIIADQDLVLTGGHNPWDVDYLRDAPIFDLSMEGRGQMGLGTSRFVNKLWEKVSDWSSYSFENSNPTSQDPFGIQSQRSSRHISHPAMVNKTEGQSKIIGMGRMGFNYFQTNTTANPSDDGLRFLIDSAKTSLYIAQQDYYSGLATPDFLDFLPTRSPSWAINSLVEAIKRGVKISFVKSDQPGLKGYGIIPAEQTYSNLLKTFEAKIRASDIKDLNGRSVRQYLCDQTEFLPWRFNVNEKNWPADRNGNALRIGAHPKLIIVDEASFAIGSQNLYPANLQEFTLVVNDANITQSLLDQYWRPLHQNSSSSRLPCK